MGSKAAKEKIVSDNTGLVWSIARRFVNRGYDLEELYQIGCIGLLKACDRFESRYGVQFSTYAVPLIAVYEAAAPKQTDTSADTATAPSATPSGKDDYKKQKEEQARLRKKENDIKKTEQKIEETEAAIAQIDEEFLNPEYATNSAKLGELSKKREELEETLSALYETWETLLA